MTPRSDPTTSAWAIAAAVVWNVSAAVLGLWAGYTFGHRVAGLWLGGVAALCAGAFCTLMADAVAARMLRARTAAQP